MKNNSTNTFSGGLNYDLTPLGTPNNVLTDCVNGTFITFNGDELVLQNDAGNTKIAVPDTDPVEYVQLTPGFYPLGIKEYGGVLYIVSAKLKSLPTIEWSDNGEYSLDQDIKYTRPLGVVYYRSKKNNNRDPLPVESDVNWEYIGDEKAYNNRYAEVEFGSYPSPEASGSKEFPGKDIIYCNVSENPFGDCGSQNLFNKLYKRIQINDADFKSTRYITFNSLLTEVSNISNYSWESGILTYSPIFYKMKLYHQLNSGYLDLTDDIWNKYFEFKNSTITGNYWFSDENDNFGYYCPSRYKGKLAVSLEIEELESFRLYTVPKLNYDGSDYTFVLDVEAIGIGIINVPEVRIQLWIDGVEIPNLPNITITDGLGRFTSDLISDTYKDSTIKYRLTPVLLVEGNTYTEVDDPLQIPKEYWEKFVIEGSRLINAYYDDIVFELSNGECNYPVPNVSVEGYKVYKEIILTNGIGSYINSSLEPSLIPYVFLLEGTTPTDPSSVIIGYYTFGYSGFSITPQLIYPLEDLSPDPQLDDVILSLLEKTPFVIWVPDECVSVSPTFEPKYVGVNSVGIPSLIDETGSVVKSSFTANLSRITDARYTVIDYYNNGTIKQLFVGGQGVLHIYDLADPQNISHKSIFVYGAIPGIGTPDVTTVNVITNNGLPHLIVGQGYRGIIHTVLIQSDINNYKHYNEVGSGIVAVKDIDTSSGNTNEWVRGALYYGGRYYVSTAWGEVFTAFGPLSATTTWTQLFDVDASFLGIKEGQNKLWVVGANQRMFQSNKSLINFKEWKLPQSVSSKNQIILKTDETLVVTTAADKGLWKTNISGSTITSTNISPIESGINGIDYINNGCFDGTRYAYFSGRLATGINKICKFDAYPTDSTYPWTYTQVPESYYALYLY